MRTLGGACAKNLPLQVAKRRNSRTLARWLNQSAGQEKYSQTVGQHSRDDTKPGADQTGQATFPKREEQNIDSHVGNIISQENMAKREEDAG